MEGGSSVDRMELSPLRGNESSSDVDETDSPFGPRGSANGNGTATASTATAFSFSNGPGAVETRKRHHSAQNATDGTTSSAVFKKIRDLSSPTRRGSTVSLDASLFKNLADAEPFFRSERKIIPSSEERMTHFCKDLVRTYKKTSLLKDALLSTWVKKNLSHRCSDGDRNGILHVAAKLNEDKLVIALCQIGVDKDLPNLKGDTATHLACDLNLPKALAALLQNRARTELRNHVDFTPLQIACVKLHKTCIELLLSKNHRADHEIVSRCGETVLHLACRGLYIRFRNIQDQLYDAINCEEENSESSNDMFSNFCVEIQERYENKTSALLKESFPVLKLLLDALRSTPRLVELEDTIKHGPGTILNYFSAMNYFDGVKIIMEEPFLVSARTLNKLNMSALLIAAHYNNTRVGMLLLQNGADPLISDSDGQTPLHMAIDKYTQSRTEETCNFIDALIEKGADPRAVDNSGETPAHMATKTLDFRVISKFIHFLGEEALLMKDSSGNTLFHFAVAFNDENAIYKLIESGADLMSRNETEETTETVGGAGGDVLQRMSSIVIRHRLPLQEAIKNSNGKSYFNALRRVDLHSVCSRWNPKDLEEFLCAHIIAAAREIRPDILRLLFQHIDSLYMLHRVLLYCDKGHVDEMFTKTALEWAVENDDRLCTTEILHHEFECHRDSKVEGLTCLRRQLAGDELLSWTIETFTMFYDKTFAQRTLLPILGLFPLICSIATFIYDYYSDIELTLEYYAGSTLNLANAGSVVNDSLAAAFSDLACQDGLHVSDLNSSHVVVAKDALGGLTSDWHKCARQRLTLGPAAGNVTDSDEECADIVRSPEEYLTAFIVNLVCIALPLVTFFCMCARELLPSFKDFVDKCTGKLPFKSFFAVALGLFVYPIWILVAFVCAPFFIIFVAARNVYYKYKHRRAKRKNLVRRPLQESEFLWGISRTAEAGLESCGQLILQLWLLSSYFKSLSEVHFGHIMEKAYNGFLFFITFSYKPADIVEKNLGKICMSMFSLVFGVSACYRTLKRGSVRMSNSIFIILSILLQIVARMYSIGLYFFTVRQFAPLMPVLLLVHFCIVTAIKLTFERARNSRGMLSWLVFLINVFASSLVFVRIVPIEKKKKDLDRLAPDEYRRRQLKQHSTFVEQSLFFLLAFVENVLLASAPLLVRGPSRATACVDVGTLLGHVGYVVLICGCSWVCHVLYYKYMGHPWSDINGPDASRERVRVNFHWRGKERTVEWRWCPGARTTAEEEDADEKDGLAGGGRSGCADVLGTCVVFDQDEVGRIIDKRCRAYV